MVKFQNRYIVTLLNNYYKVHSESAVNLNVKLDDKSIALKNKKRSGYWLSNIHKDFNEHLKTVVIKMTKCIKNVTVNSS
jgi:hypothetical protein